MLGASQSVREVVPFNYEYFQLFVIGGELFQTDHFIVPKDRALTESISREVMDKLACLSAEAVSTIKTYPALIMSENKLYGRATDDQVAIYGIVKDIKIQDNGIKVYYHPLNFIRQQVINNLALELDLGRTSSFNELNRTHWAIKRINLVEVLKNAGISVFTIS